MSFFYSSLSLPYNICITDTSMSYSDGTELESAFEPFLMRSSPPLVSLYIQADDCYFSAWHRRLLCVCSTVYRPARMTMSSLFPFKGESIVAFSSFPNLRSLRVQDVACDLPLARPIFGAPRHLICALSALSGPHLPSWTTTWYI
jgi:hypothetical protein